MRWRYCLLLSVLQHSSFLCIFWRALLQDVPQKLEGKVWYICYKAFQCFVPSKSRSAPIKPLHEQHLAQ